MRIQSNSTFGLIFYPGRPLVDVPVFIGQQVQKLCYSVQPLCGSLGGRVFFRGLLLVSVPSYGSEDDRAPRGSVHCEK